MDEPLDSLLQIHDGFGGGGNQPSSRIVLALWCLRGDRPQADLFLPLAYKVANRLAALSHPDQTLAGLEPASIGGAIGTKAALGRLLARDVGTLANLFCRNSS